jgi:predicted permease
MRRINLMENLGRDLRFGLRAMRQSPAFTTVAVLTLALGIGANTAIFSVVHAALLRPLPYQEPDRLITLGESRLQQQIDPLSTGTWNASNPDYLDWKSQSKAFQSLAGFVGDGFIMKGLGEPELVVAVQSTVNFFSVLGVKPVLGRDFAFGEDAAEGPNVCILSYGFWRDRFGGDAHAIGRSIQLGKNSVRIVGVLPAEFEFAPRGNTQVWVPFHIGQDLANRRSLRWMRVIGRLGEGVSASQARTEMDLINKRLTAAYPQQNDSVQVVMIPLRDRIVGRVRPLLLILFGAVGFVLLIACANVANLLMARATGRRREFAIRVALGAGRGRLISQLLAESLMLAAAGGALGLFLARFGTGPLISAIPQAQLDSMPFLRDAHANPAVLAFVCAAVILTGLAFGLAPAFEIQDKQAGAALNEESRGSASGIRTRVRDVLVVVEIAFSLVLLVGAGLMVKSLGALLHRNPRNVLTFSVFLPPASYPDDPDALRFDRGFSDRIHSLPGVAGIASNSVVPLTGGGNTIRFVIEGRPAKAGQDDECNIRDISNGYFSTMGIPLIAGRSFDDAADSASMPQHLIVTESFVKRHFHGENAIGKRLKFTYSPKEKFREIVGVAGDIADAGLDSPAEPELFVPFLQSPNSFISYIVRTAGEPSRTIGAVQAVLREADPQLMLIRPITMDQLIAQSPAVFLRRYPSYLIGSFAALALVLAMVGLYGLISYAVSQRVRELGIRIALGAQQRDVMRLVMGQGARLAIAGVAAGILAALALTKLMRSLLFGVSAADPLIFAVVAVLLTIVAMAACWIPARRAMRTDPVVALRHE